MKVSFSFGGFFDFLYPFIVKYRGAKNGGIMKMNQRSFAWVFALQLLWGSFLVFSQEVEAQSTSTTYSHETISIEVNSANVAEIIKKNVIEQFVANNNNLSMEMINVEESKIFIETLDTMKVSTQKTNILVQLKPMNDHVALIQESISGSYIVDIVDTQAPDLVLYYDTLQVRLGTEFNPRKAIQSAMDNTQVDYTEDVVVVGLVDTTMLGNYVLTFSVQDKKMNTVTKSLFVQVKQYANAQGANSEGAAINEMLRQINEQRALYGLNPLALADESGQWAAAIRAQESIGDISHRRPDGSHYKTALSEQGVVWQHSPLEILTYAGGTVESSLNWWMNSSGHRSILLQPNYETIAIGKAGSMWAAILY